MRRGRKEYLELILGLSYKRSNKTACLILLNPLVFHAVAKTNFVEFLSGCSNKSIVGNTLGRNALHDTDFYK